MRTIAIGDIHGTSSALDALLAAVRPTPDDTLVFLGDYVDRGPDTRGTLERILALRQSLRVVCLRGNHEVMMLAARRSNSERRMWMSVGGAQALASYGKAPGLTGTLDDVPPEHWDFLEKGLLPSHETETHIFVHANVDPGRPLAEQTEEHLYWEFLQGPVRHISGKTVVVGHSSQRSGQPLDYGSIVCIDTYAYGGGWLTALDVATRSYWQADVLGRVRTAKLGERPA